MFRIIITIIIIALSYATKAQEVVSSGGGCHQNSTSSITWTLGETAIHTLRANDKIITQGFHQTKLTVTAVNEIPGLKMIISAFPNPTNDFINLKVDGSIEKLSFSVYDLNGRLLKTGRFEANPEMVSFQDLGSAIYLIKVFEDKQEVKTFRVVKQ
jgi:hypothetical protein